VTNMLDIRLSPDQKRAAVQLRNEVGVNDDIWIVDLIRGVLSRFSFHAAIDDFPVWSPDGMRLLFSSTRDGAPSIYQTIYQKNVMAVGWAIRKITNNTRAKAP
jgi:Tol biopolymer transport system component